MEYRDRGGRSRFPRVENFSEPLYDDVKYINESDYMAIGLDVINQLKDVYYGEAPPAQARLVMQKRIANYAVELYKQLAWDRVNMDDNHHLGLEKWRNAWIRNANEQCALNKWCAVFSDDPANWFRPLEQFGLVDD